MPTLSVCIPIYQTDVRQLVNELCHQLDALDPDFAEIILIDDASDASYRALNQFTHPKVRVIEFERNLGRSKIRNAFAAQSAADYLLFIDGDSRCCRPDFLLAYQRYLAQHDASVVVGASIYQQKKPAAAQRLRWNYSTKRESLSYQHRLNSPHAGFKTNNFVIMRQLLLAHPFEERLSGYGHEDSLFGLLLTQQQISIDHIDNPVENPHLDTNTQFLKKTENALQNLVWIRDNYPKAIWREFKLLTYYEHLKAKFFLRILLSFGGLFLPIIRIYLRSGMAPIVCFDVYRLLKLHQLDKPAS
ncbi:MAG: hypothetical protein RLZZ301_1566 [Bacteroidota bacterium]|jgi:glycosyltransferase involved in cell wall biosynthesis